MFTRKLIHLSCSTLHKSLLVMPSTYKAIEGHWLGAMFINVFSSFQNSQFGIQEFRNQRYSCIIIKTQPLLPLCMCQSRISLSTKTPESEQSSDLSSEKEEREAVLKWIELLRYEGENVPAKITEEQMDMLMKHHKTYMSKKKYLSYLSIKETAEKNDREKLLIRRKKRDELREKQREEHKSHIEYGLWRNSMFAKVENNSINNLHIHNLARGMMFGLPLVIDCGFSDVMTVKESNSLSEQLVYCISQNKINEDPVNMYLCNFEENTLTDKFLKNRMPNVSLPDFPINITPKSYLDLFPKDKLIYLTPDARSVMDYYDPEAVYVIGGLVDLSPKGPLTLAKAKKEGIKMMKLPVDRYARFKGMKTLGIHVVAAMLFEVQKSGDWMEAMRYIPKRFVNSKGPNIPSPWDERISKTKRT